MPSLGGFLTSIWHYAGLGSLATAAVATISAVILMFAAYVARGARQDVRYTFAFAMLTTVVVGHHVNSHDMALLFPVLLIFGTAKHQSLWRLAAVALLWCSPLYLLLLSRQALTWMFLPLAVLFAIVAWQMRGPSRVTSALA
jgi:hypothetical protein